MKMLVMRDRLSSGSPRGWWADLQASFCKALYLVRPQKRYFVTPLVDSLRRTSQSPGEPCRSPKMLDGVRGFHGTYVSILTKERQGC